MPDFAEISRLDATAQAELVRSGALSAEELLQACEQRVRLLEPLIHAFSSVNFERARAKLFTAPLKFLSSTWMRPEVL